MVNLYRVSIEFECATDLRAESVLSEALLAMGETFNVRSNLDFKVITLKEDYNAKEVQSKVD